MLQDNLKNKATGDHKMSLVTLVIGIVVLVILGAGLLACAWFVYTNNTNETAKLWATIGCIVIAIPILLYAYHLYKVTGSVISITSSAIARKERDGSQVSVMWGELGTVLEKPAMQQLVVTDKTGAKKVIVDYQFNDYESIRQRVFEEFEKRLSETYPVQFGKTGLSIKPAHIGLFLILGGISALILILDKKSELYEKLIAPGIFMAIIIAIYAIDQFGSVKQVIIRADGVTIKKLLSTVELPYNEIVDIEWKYILSKSQYGGEIDPNDPMTNKQSVVEIVRVHGNPITISTSIGNLPEVYLRLCLAAKKAGVTCATQNAIKTIKASDLL